MLHANLIFKWGRADLALGTTTKEEDTVRKNYFFALDSFQDPTGVKSVIDFLDVVLADNFWTRSQ